MVNPDFLILYVDDPAKSAVFYSDLFKRDPVESSPTFVMFSLPSGLNFCVWSKHTVTPPSQITGGGMEVNFALPDRQSVDTTYEEWKKKGIDILQSPVVMECGYTFMGADPDGHRLRVLTMEE